MAAWTLGIETTAHTLSFGLVDAQGTPYPAASDTLRPDQGGIHPREAADHHKEVAAELFQRALGQHDLTVDDIGAVAYSPGSRFGPLFASRCCRRTWPRLKNGRAPHRCQPLRSPH